MSIQRKNLARKTKRTIARHRNSDEVWQSKFKMSLDYIFGKGTSKGLDFSNLGFQFSQRTGRLRYILEKDSGQILFSFRANGSIAPTVNGACYLLKWATGSTKPKKRIKSRPRWVVTVIDGVTDVVSGGKTVFCKHVVHCDDSIRANEDVAVMNERGELLAVGRTILSAPTMKQFKRGAAIKVREGRANPQNVTDAEHGQ